jgi:asparagine synthase (glutamine-hydrolysing)
VCGIVGIAGFRDVDLVRGMAAQLRHRGPDGEGFHFEGEASLGHRRLAIIDIESGAQPMATRDGTVWVTFNGQIYNYRTIVQELEAEYPFQTHCDTEVLPVLYQREGSAMLQRLRGMFAFAIWDSPAKRLFLARDRIGIKPLYYAQLGHRLLFASEPKALLLHPEVDRSIDPVALDAYLSLLYVPPPHSIFRGIRQLPPGHTLTWQAGEVKIEKYWDIVPCPEEGRTAGEWAEEIAPILHDSIRMRMMSDVPLGAFLSGGIDSSTIVSVLAEHSSQPVETFCIGFGVEGAAYEERPVARRVAQFFHTHHHEIEVSIDMASGIEELVRGFDEPFGNPTAMLTSTLSKFTREFVTVSLSGDGGDELFGGYPRYRGMLWADLLARFPHPLRRLAQAWAGAREPSTARNYRRWLRELLEGAQLPPTARYSSWMSYADASERDLLLAPAIKTELGKGRIDPVSMSFTHPAGGRDTERAVYADLHGYLPENVLRYADRMSMIHSLEVRVPFTDHVLVEALARVPAPQQISLLASKRLLRRIMKGKLPEEVIRRKKLGLNPPMGTWLRGDSKGLLAEWLDPDQIRRRGLLNPGEVKRLIGEHQSHFRDHGLRLWSLIVLEAWMRMYVDQS